MLEGRDIIIFGDDWGWYPSTIQHIGRLLARNNRILWIGSLGLRKPRLHLYDIKRAVFKGRRLLRQRGAATPPGVVEVFPFILPFHDRSFFRGFNYYSLLVFLRSSLNRLRFTKPILITSSPIVGDLLGHLGETSSHYLCLDDWTEFKDSVDCLADLERDLLRKVDGVFAVSDLLVSTRQNNLGKSHLLPQGVDTAHFSRTTELPEEVASLPKPIVGYFGLLAPWVDIDLLIKAAQHYKEVSFVLLGRSHIDLSRLRSVSNISYLGEIPFNELPRYASAFDVGLIPFTLNNLTYAANPLKLLEYLSLGIPVVSTALPEVMKFQESVFVAHDENNFIRLIQEALNDRSAERAGIRRMIAERYSWERITRQLSEAVLEIEATKRQKRAFPPLRDSNHEAP